MKLRHEHSIVTTLGRAITNIQDGFYHMGLEFIRQAEKQLAADIREYDINEVDYRKNELRTKITELQQELYNLGETE